MDAEVIITNWSGLSGRFLNLLNSGEMFDVQLRVGGHSYDAHKLILSASSDVFKTMLTSRKWSESNKETIVLIEDPLCENVFGRFIHYIYTGQLYLSHKTVCPMLTLADKYNVKELIPLCQKYMLENLDVSMHISSVLQWWTVSNLRNEKALGDKILSYIELNFNKVLQSTEFLYSSIDTVEKLFSRSKLVVHNELIIYCGVKNWVHKYMDLNSPTDVEIFTLLSRLLRHIRWPMMTTDEINWLSADLTNQSLMLEFLSFNSPNLVSLMIQEVGDTAHSETSRMSEIFSNLCLLANNMQERVYCLSQSSQDADHSSLTRFPSDNEANDMQRNQILSRVYTCDYWGTELKVTDFTAFPDYGVQTFFFSTPRTGFCQDEGYNLDWEVELYPKGIHFPAAIMIGVERDGSRMIEEVFVNTVRLSVMSRSHQEMPLKVEVNILVRGNSSSAEPGATYFERNHCRTCVFEYEGQRQNFDNVIPLDNIGTYLQPSLPIPELHLTPTVDFALCIVIRPLAR